VEAGTEVDRYSLEIKLPADYPASPSEIFEVAGEFRVYCHGTQIRPDHFAVEFPSKLWITLAGDFSIKKALYARFWSATA
jgi:hypothetical protein